jgi:hypothetical protein
MAKVNFRQQKRQKELARKQRQDERMRRRGEAPVVDTATTLTEPVPKPADGQT